VPKPVSADTAQVGTLYQEKNHYYVPCNAMYRTVFSFRMLKNHMMKLDKDANSCVNGFWPYFNNTIWLQLEGTLA
jgi:hypothetical protein